MPGWLMCKNRSLQTSFFTRALLYRAGAAVRARRRGAPAWAVPMAAGGVAVGFGGALAGSGVCTKGALRFGGGWRPDSSGDDGGSGW
jgi:hypothetical protein